MTCRPLCMCLLLAAIVTVPCRAQQAPVAPTPPPAAIEEQLSTPQSEPALKLPPSEPIADTLVFRGRYLAAIHVYEALPQTPAVLNKLGIACLHMLMFDRARASFEAALKLNPKYSEAYNNMGTLAHSQGDIPRAEKMYKKALKLKPDSANTLQNLGTLYYSERKFKKGDDAYKKAIAIDPGVLEHSSQRGIMARSKAGSASELHYHMAATYASAGSRDLALKYLRQAIGEGFRDRNRLLHDKEFADLRTSEVFLNLVDDLKKD